MGMVLRGKRRYGGYVVHLGIVLMFLGFAGTAYQKETRRQDGRRRREQDRQVHRSASTSLAHEEDRQKEMVTGELTVLVDGKVLDHMRPAKWFFHKHESEPTTEVAIRRAPAEDLYITLGNYDLAEGTRHPQAGGEPAWSTGSGSGSCCWRSAPASRSCPTRCSSG